MGSYQFVQSQQEVECFRHQNLVPCFQILHSYTVEICSQIRVATLDKVLELKLPISLITYSERGKKSSIPCDYRMSLYLSIGVLQPHFVAKADKVEVIWYIMLLQLGSQHLSSLAAACVQGVSN